MPGPGLKVPIITLAFRYNRDRIKRKAAERMTNRFEYVNGHVEVFTNDGEFLFSADTMEEAWRELCA